MSTFAGAWRQIAKRHNKKGDPDVSSYVNKTKKVTIGSMPCFTKRLPRNAPSWGFGSSVLHGTSPSSAFSNKMTTQMSQIRSPSPPSSQLRVLARMLQTNHKTTWLCLQLGGLKHGPKFLADCPVRQCKRVSAPKKACV